jgi:hypothetical protein
MKTRNKLYPVNLGGLFHFHTKFDSYFIKRCELDSSYGGWPVTHCCEYGSEPSVPIKHEKFVTRVAAVTFSKVLYFMKLD